MPVSTPVGVEWVAGAAHHGAAVHSMLLRQVEICEVANICRQVHVDICLLTTCLPLFSGNSSSMDCAPNAGPVMHLWDQRPLPQAVVVPQGWRMQAEHVRELRPSFLPCCLSKGHEGIEALLQ